MLMSVIKKPMLTLIMLTSVVSTSVNLTNVESLKQPMLKAYFLVLTTNVYLNF